MRLSLRKVAQVVFVFACCVLFNCMYVLLVKRNANTITYPLDSRATSTGQGEQYQNGDRRASDTDKLKFIPHQRLPPVLAVVNSVDVSGRKVSSLDRRKRSLDYYPGNVVHERRHLDVKSLRNLGRGGSYVAQLDQTLPQRKTELSDIFISVKTTKKFHHDRLDLILDTWFVMARDQTYFFTDTDDSEYQRRTRGHMVNTNCSSVHNRPALCCKMSVEYDSFLASGKRWFCHMDDDTYLNIPALLTLVQRYNHTQDWYLGKPSLNHPLEVKDIENKEQKTMFWFATGGAGVCISRSLALKMMPFTAGGRLSTVCEKIRLPDDCTIGFIIYYYLHKELTVVRKFHSHLEGLWGVKTSDLSQQITFSYAQTKSGWNIVRVPGFPVKEDPTRFRSIHCALYPYMKGCPTKAR